MSVVQRSWHWDHILKPSETHHPCTFQNESRLPGQGGSSSVIRCAVLLLSPATVWLAVGVQLRVALAVQTHLCRQTHADADKFWLAARRDASRMCARATNTKPLMRLVPMRSKNELRVNTKTLHSQTQTRRAPRAQTRAQTTENPSVSDKQNGCVPFGSPGKWKLLTEQLAS